MNAGRLRTGRIILAVFLTLSLSAGLLPVLRVRAEETTFNVTIEGASYS